MRQVKRWVVLFCYHGTPTIKKILSVGSIMLFVVALLYYLFIQIDRQSMQMVPCEVIDYGVECYLLSGQVFVCQVNNTNCQYVSECSCALSYKSALQCMREAFPIGSEYECFLVKGILYLTDPATSFGLRLLIFSFLLSCTVFACNKNRCFCESQSWDTILWSVVSCKTFHF